MDNTRVFRMAFASVYPHYIAKAEKKGRTKEEVHAIIHWLTGYDEPTLQQQIDKKVDFETFFAHTEPWMASISKVEYGDPETQRDLLRSLSPLHKLDRVTAPTLVLHGANDTNVPVVEAEQVVAALKQRGVPVEYVLFPDEGHGFRKTPNRIRSQVALVSWFDQHLRAPAAAPAAPAARR